METRITENRFASSCRVRRKPVSTTAGVSGCGVRFNRQLHPVEKTLAKQLAHKSGGVSKQAQKEDQMRIIGVSVNGKAQSGAPDTVIGQMPTDLGATWTFSAILTEI